MAELGEDSARLPHLAAVGDSVYAVWVDERDIPYDPTLNFLWLKQMVLGYARSIFVERIQHGPMVHQGLCLIPTLIRDQVA